MTTTPVLAEQEPAPWEMCGHYEPSLPTYLDRSLASELAPTRILADHSQSVPSVRHTLTGDVKLWRGTQWIEADRATYDQSTDLVDAQGNVRLGDLNLSTSGDSGQFNLSTQTGYVDNAQYRLHEKHARGTAQSVIISGPNYAQLKNATLTTCNEGDNDWYIHAASVRLNRESGFGTAAPIYVTFHGVPILFSPYISFPLNDKRKTGLLVPSFGRSSTSGTEIAAPYYFNLAPNYDATITPHSMTRRGVQFNGEFRYLLENSGGKIYASILPNDSVYGDDRSFYGFVHSGTPREKWRTELDTKHVSDKDYLADFGNSLSASVTSHLEQRFDLSYGGERTAAQLRLQSYQTVDKNISPSERPYRRLPQILYGSSIPLMDDALLFELNGELVRFDQTDRLNANRIDLTPQLSLPYLRQAFFFSPKVTLRYTLYALDPPEANSDAERDISRTVPITSVDTGIFLERSSRWGEKPMLQTLEPRLFYVNAPFEDQSDIPVFDSGDTTFSFAQLFRINRFNGADRVGDTDQLSVALTTRFIDQDTGIERLRASIGQIFYMRDRRVTLSGSEVDTSSQSDIVGEFSTTITDNWTTRGDAIWNHATDEIDQGSVTFQYKSSAMRIFNASYRWTRASLTEQTDFSLIWPISRNWHIIGRRLFAHRKDQSLETLVGLEYNSCCWALRLLNRRYLDTNNTEADKIKESFMIQLEFKGLTNLGNPIEQVMAQGIPGFEGRASSSQPQ